MAMLQLEPTKEGVLIPVHAQPRARRNGIVGFQAGRLKVAVTAPADKGKANDAILRVLADQLGLKPAQIALTSGASARHKKFLVTDVAAAELERRIAACLDARTD